MDYLVYVEALGIPEVNFSPKYIKRSVKQERGISVINEELLFGNEGYLNNYFSQMKKFNSGFSINSRESLLNIKSYLHNQYSHSAMEVEKRVLKGIGTPKHSMDLIDKYCLASELERVVKRAIDNNSSVIIKKLDSEFDLN